MTRKQILTIFFVTIWIPGYSYFKDTVKVKNVTVKRKKIEQISGFKREQIDEEVLALNPISDLSQIISENSPIYVKSYGQNGIATVSFRGTNATHTAVNWNGVPLNSITLGQFDFSLIPAFFMDNVGIGYGSSSLKNSSGSFGGSVEIENKANWNKSYKNKYAVSYGSNNSITAFARDVIRTQKWMFKTRAFVQHSDNDYYYENDQLSMEVIKGHRKHAGYRSAGLMEEIYFRPSSYSSLNFNFWAQHNYRELPVPFVVDDRNGREGELDNNNIRTSLNYKSLINDWEIKATVSYLFEEMKYNSKFVAIDQDTTYKNESNTIFAKFDLKYKINEFSSIEFGMDNKYDYLNSNQHISTFIDRNKFSSFLGLDFNYLNSYKLSSLIRQDIDRGEVSELTFSSGIDVRIFTEKDYFFKFNIAKNIHRPNLNDLYYKPNGNPNLKEEKGLNYESSIMIEDILTESIRIETHLTGYFMDVKDWIIWKYDGVFGEPTPKNYSKVESKGFELFNKLTFKHNEFSTDLITNYTYTSSKNKSDIENINDNSRNKQLIYVPKHKVNFRTTTHYKNWNLSYNLNYVGDRYTSTDNSGVATEYIIHDLSLSYSFKAFEKENNLQLKVDNIANTLYYSVKFYPMPYRQINLIYSIDM